MSSVQRRVTQRAPQSCVYCSRRKLRCSKTIPCSNCIERGIQARCHREAVILSSQSLRQRDRSSRSPTEYERTRRSPNPSVGGVLETTATAPVEGPRVLPNFGASRHSHLVNNTETSLDAVDVLETPRNIETAQADEHSHESCLNPSEGDLAIEAAMSLESLAWGTTHLDHNRLLPSPTILTLLEELRNLIDSRKAREILNFHKVHVTWMHNVVYMPYFLRECEGYLTGRLQRDAAWLSLYCAVLCTGVYYMSKSQHLSLGFQDGYAISKRLYHITMETIMRSDFMVSQSLHSVQAISVILMCAHSLGDSRRMKVLLSCANTVAQNISHRLHRQSSSASGQPSFGELVDREVRKRVWVFLCTQDWYLIASNKSYSISPNHGTIPIPANCTEDLEDTTENGIFQDHPLTVQTQSTYMIFLFKLSSQYRALFDQLSVIHARNGSVADCFDAVLSIDSQLESIMGEIEQCRTGTSSTIGQQAPSQWRALIIASWHKRVMIHRSFFCRSFQDRRYHYSRFVCLAAARNIIRSYLDSGCTEGMTEIWSIPTHAISACIIITLNSLFTAEKHIIEKSDMDLMNQCLALLKSSPRPNSIVNRGIHIIRYLLNQGPQCRFKKLDPPEISQLARNIDTEGPESHQDAAFNDDNSFAEAITSQLDILESVNSHFGDDELFMPYWYDPTVQNYSL